MSLYSPFVEVPSVYAKEFVETIEQKIDRVATTHGIATTTLYNLAMSESSLGEKRVGDNGKSCGLVHFHQDYYPDEFARCGDDEYILNRAAEMIANNEGWKFVPCNCFAFAEVLTPYKLPRMNEIVPNEVYPRVGSLAILRYKNNKHIGVIESVVKEGFYIREANFQPCKLDKRLIEWEDPHLKGYYRP